MWVIRFNEVTYYFMQKWYAEEMCDYLEHNGICFTVEYLQ